MLRAELARLQVELATAEEQARAAADLDRLTEEFIATASQDLKAPLATLRGYSQLLLRRLQQPQPDLELLARGLAQIDAQAHAMARLLDDLVGNALKYSPPETTVQVRVEWRGAHLQVAVIDSGMGLPPDELARLFQRFHRTPQAIASGVLGTGLGLYLCRGIIEAHGGRLWAASQGAGHGATFQFTLPSHAPAAASGQDDAERKERPR